VEWIRTTILPYSTSTRKKYINTDVINDVIVFMINIFINVNKNWQIVLIQSLPPRGDIPECATLSPLNLSGFVFYSFSKHKFTKSSLPAQKFCASIFNPTFFEKVMDHVIFVKILRCRISMVKKQNRFLPPRLKLTKIDQKPLKFAYFSM
jgi:hypothetical protein